MTLRTDLDPEAAGVVAEIEAQGVPDWSAMSVPAARHVEDEVFSGGDPPAVSLVRDLAVPGNYRRTDDEGEIPVRVYRDDTGGRDGDAPVLVYYHGGGWLLGTLDSIDGVCRRLATRGNCVVVSVDYRLAPEHPFPAPVADASAALRWVGDHADAFGGNPERLAVAGTSAGGNLAAVTALRAGGGHPADDALPDIARQFLFYPMTDYGFDSSSGQATDSGESVAWPDDARAGPDDARHDSYRENADAPLLTTADVRWFWDHYLRNPVDAANPYAAPLRAPDLGDVAPATVLTAGHDPLRDEGVAYADRLADAGVAVRHDHFPAMPHGFLSLSESVSVADDALESVAAELRSL